MIRYFLILLSILFISGCAAPGSALLSPVFTGVTTKSTQQASLSLTSSLISNQTIRNNSNEIKKMKNKITTRSKKVLDGTLKKILLK